MLYSDIPFLLGVVDNGVPFLDKTGIGDNVLDVRPVDDLLVGVWVERHLDVEHFAIWTLAEGLGVICHCCDGRGEERRNGSCEMMM